MSMSIISTCVLFSASMASLGLSKESTFRALSKNESLTTFLTSVLSSTTIIAPPSGLTSEKSIISALKSLDSALKSTTSTPTTEKTNFEPLPT